MLRSVKDLDDYVVGATDGIIGHVKDFYFDDKAWVIRYLVVNAGTWLSSRKVLISPISIARPDWTEKILPVRITKEQVKNSPNIDTEKPVLRQHEAQLHEHYGYPFYWDGAGPWGGEPWGGGVYASRLVPAYAIFGSTPHAEPSEADKAYARAEGVRHQDDDPHLRSCKTVMRYHVHASDGDIGHVYGLLVDDETWAIRYFVVATSHWWAGHHVLITPKWIKDISWSDSAVSVNPTQQAVKDAPLYDLDAQLTSEREVGIYDHYEHLGYWVTEVKQLRDVLHLPLKGSHI